jgi:hypothetical protein
VSAHPEEKTVVRPPESGWAQSRNPPDNSLRTCVAAVEGRTGPGPRRGPEGNIVRGED